jgi:glyoxylase-like metal-dependent hydrolase (beta-lactamase superfamily II)
MLADPAKGLSVDLTALFGGRLPYTEPEDVAELTDGATLTLAGVEITVDHAPGHTGGSVLFRLPGETSSWDAEEFCLSGDVLFAGSIGRTDLPGGSTPTMMATLRDKILPLADDTVVLPGHGPETTIGRERLANPYLRDLTGAPGRGL